MVVKIFYCKIKQFQRPKQSFARLNHFACFCSAFSSLRRRGQVMR